jgi:stage II sporulation protein D
LVLKLVKGGFLILRNKTVTVSIAIMVMFIIVILSGCTPAKKLIPKKYINEPTISLYVNETGQIKQIKMEEYIKGVVAAEMDTSWPVNALAAQAILARTFTLKQMKDKGGVPAHKTDASTSIAEFQAYDVKKINANVIKAVELTRGEVLKYNGSYINAWFSACDGGVEASAKEGLAFEKEKTPYIKTGTRDGCLAITVPENKQWTAAFPLDKVRATVISITGRDPGLINSGNVSIALRGPSGRAEKINIGKTIVGGPALRLALGNDVMRSVLLDSISVQSGKVVMSGRGYGHGVGMCQWGAKKMASEGKVPEEIVSFYFNNVTVDKLWK